MKMQIAFDTTDINKALLLATSLEPFADMFEIGTLLLYKHGETVIRRFKEQFPTKTLVIDSKIIDHAKESAVLFSDAGADYMTVMAGAPAGIIRTICATAHEKNKKVFLDLIDSNAVGQSALEAESLGADGLIIHRSTNPDQELFFLDKWEMIKGNTHLPIYISCNSGRDIIEDIVSLDPAGIILGKNISQATDPVAEARFYYDLITRS